MVCNVHRKPFECFLQALIREVCFMCRYFAHKWTVNIFWFRFVFASWLILLKCWSAQTNYYTYTQKCWSKFPGLLSPVGLPGGLWCHFQWMHAPRAPLWDFRGRYHHSSVAYTGETCMAISISRVSLQLEEVVCDTLFTQGLPMTEV